MDWGGILQNLFFDYTLRTVALGAMVLGIVSGALGTFAVLRRQSLLGDAISHAALPGVVLAFLITRSKESIVLITGAIAAGWIGTLWFMSIIKITRIKADSALAFILSVFFGLGLMLLTFTQRLSDSRQAGLEHFLFGQAAALLERDVITIAVLGGVALLLMAIFWKEFKLLSFDREYGSSLGFPMGILDVVLTSLLVIAIVIGLQAVGVVLMSALLVAPAAAARQWTDRLGVMSALSAIFGALAGVSGAVTSSILPGFSTGPTVVLSASAIVLFSLFLAPNRGLFWNWLRHQRNRRKLHVERILSDLYELALQHEGSSHGHSTAVLRMMNSRQLGVSRSLEVLKVRGLVEETSLDHWALTARGLAEAEQLSPDPEQRLLQENDPENR